MGTDPATLCAARGGAVAAAVAAVEVLERRKAAVRGDGLDRQRARLEHPPRGRQADLLKFCVDGAACNLAESQREQPRRDVELAGDQFQ